MKYKNNGAIWINKTKTGQPYFSFRAERDIKEGEKFNFFKNDKGGVETRPDYKSYEKIEEETQEVNKNLVQDVTDSIPF
jgi:hypothetical protein